MKTSSFAFLCLTSLALAAPSPQRPDSGYGSKPDKAEQTILVGSYTTSIYTLKLSKSNAKPRLSLVASSPVGSSAPSWISKGPGEMTVLASFENANIMQTFNFDPKAGALTPQSKPVETVVGPVYSGFTLDGKHAIALGYTNGGYTMASYNGSDLRPMNVTYPSGDPLAPVPANDTKSTHPHGFMEHPTLPLIYVTNVPQNAVHTYELKDCSLVYRATLEVAGGPRHMVVNDAGTLAWVVTETSTEVVSLAIGGNGTISLNKGDRRALTEPGKVKGFGGEIVLSTDEKHVVASNRQVEGSQNDFLTTFELKEDGTLGEARYTDTKGQRVRSMAFNDDSSLLVLGNQANDTIAVFSRESSTGELTMATDLFNITAAANETTPVQPAAFLWY